MSHPVCLSKSTDRKYKSRNMFALIIFLLSISVTVCMGVLCVVCTMYISYSNMVCACIHLSISLSLSSHAKKEVNIHLYGCFVCYLMKYAHHKTVKSKVSSNLLCFKYLYVKFIPILFIVLHFSSSSK